MARIAKSKLRIVKMPKWIWQLHLDGFHFQLKKYLHFIWRQRPEGCTWARVTRAKYFRRSISTIAKWDRYLLDKHLVWVTGQRTMEHRICALPYYSKHVWMTKRTKAEVVAGVAEVRAELEGFF